MLRLDKCSLAEACSKGGAGRKLGEEAASCKSILAKYETCCFLLASSWPAPDTARAAASCCGLLQQNVNWGHKLRQSGKFVLPALPAPSSSSFIVDIFEQLFEGERQTLISFSTSCGGEPEGAEGNKATRQTGQIINKHSNNNNNTCCWFKWLAERGKGRGEVLPVYPALSLGKLLLLLLVLCLVLWHASIASRYACRIF